MIIGQPIMKTPENFSTKGIAVTIILAIIAIMFSCEYNPSVSSGTSINIEFDKINPTWTQEEVIDKVKLSLLQLSTQSQTIRSQYTDWETQLRSELSGSSDYEKIRQINFANSVQEIEAKLSYNYQGYYVDTIKRYAVIYFDELAVAISGLIIGQNNVDLFKAQAEAYHMAHYINQREYYLSETEKANMIAYLALLLTEIERLGGRQHISQDNMYLAIAELKTELRLCIPRECGENRLSFIQQLEDYAQFDGWTDDLKILGYNLGNIPRAVLQ